MTEQSPRREGSPGEELGVRQGLLINFKECLGWEWPSRSSHTRRSETHVEVHGIIVACVSISRTGGILCHRGEMELQEFPPWNQFTGADRLHEGVLAPLVLAAGTLPGITGSLPSVRRTSLAPLVLLGLFLEGKVGGCD